MRIATIILALGLAACGGKKPAPATTGPAPGSGESTPPAAAEQCCCELPSDPPAYEMQGAETCHTDSHGVCQADATKCKK